MYRTATWTIAFAITAFYAYATPHGGRTDSRGGHNGPNGYHFHGGGGAPAISSAPIVRPLLSAPSTKKRNSEVKTVPRTSARTEARTAPPSPKYKQFVVGPKFEFQLLNSSSAGKAFKGKIQITSPQHGIEFSWLREVPAKLTDKSPYTIQVLLPDQVPTEPAWAVIENGEDGAKVRVEHHRILATLDSDPSRQWTDTSGAFRRQGRLRKIAEGEVLITLIDSRELWIPTEKLCLENTDYISERLSKSLEDKQSPTDPE